MDGIPPITPYWSPARDRLVKRLLNDLKSKSQRVWDIAEGLQEALDKDYPGLEGFKNLGEWTTFHKLGFGQEQAET